VGLEVLEEPTVSTKAVSAEAGRPADAAPGSAVTRRTALAASAALPMLLTACKGIQALGTPPPPTPDVVALRSAIAAEKIMVARYASAIRLLRRQLPPRATAQDVFLYEAVRSVQAEHAAHLMQLTARLIQPTVSTPSASPSPSVQVGGTIDAELTTLEEAETAASDRLTGLLPGVPGSLAQLFASIAASEATHVPYLQAARRGR
jgi:hypothetical protein